MAKSVASPVVVTRSSELRAAIAAARHGGKRVGLVPTMGALHAGHLSLVEAAAAECGTVVVTIFVNPTQFGPHEDFRKYPRDLAADVAKLSGVGADLVFAPEAEAMYGDRHATYVEPGGVALPLEGERRPGHFRGVATIVLKLFNLASPDAAYFGRKDYQQLLVIRQMVLDLDLPIEIRDCPIVREPDGLALSSRNVYLSPAGRERALSLHRALRLADRLATAGERDAEVLLSKMRAEMAVVPDVRVDYLVLVDPNTLENVSRIAAPTLAAVAAFVDGTRLIDNRMLCDGQSAGGGSA